MDIKPIKNEENYNDALRRIEELWGAPVGSKEGDELKILTTLIEAYERELYPIHRPSPIDAIKFRLEQSGEDYRSVIGVIGQRTRVYEVMRGDRQLSLNMIRKLNSRLKIPAEVLIQPGPKPDAKTSSQCLKSEARAETGTFLTIAPAERGELLSPEMPDECGEVWRPSALRV